MIILSVTFPVTSGIVLEDANDMLLCLIIFGSNKDVLIGKLCLSKGSICLSRGMCQSIILFCLSPNLAIYSSCFYLIRDLLQYLTAGVAPGISFVQRERIINIITLQHITQTVIQLTFATQVEIGLNSFFIENIDFQQIYLFFSSFSFKDNFTYDQAIKTIKKFKGYNITFNFTNNHHIHRIEVQLIHIKSLLSKRNMVYNSTIRKQQQMEDILQTVSNDHRSIYYAVQLKLMDLSQNIRLLGTSYKENNIKIAVADMLNHSYMLQSVFEQAKILHIYQLVKSIVVNFNSVIAVLLQKLDRATQKEINLLQIINLHQVSQSQVKKSDEGVIGNGNFMKEMKKNRLGGIHLFNENYSRYIEDQMILQQIKAEKQKRLQMKRMDILRESILQDINHLTDVQESPAKSEDIANYIIKAKDKYSMFNYVSYQPELQQILEFFQKSQNEANQFLMRKMKDIDDEEGNFSFADFQRDIQLKNFRFKKNVTDKMNVYTEKYKTKQKQLQDYIKQKQNKFRQMQKRNVKCDKQIQTQMNFEEQLVEFNKKIKELTEKCHSYQSMAKKQINNGRQKELQRQLAQKQAYLEKQNKKMVQLQLSIENLNKLLKDQKIKRINSSKSIDYKSQRTIPQPAPFIEKQRQIYRPKQQKNYQNMESSKKDSSPQYTQNTKKAESVNMIDRQRRQNSDTASFLSFHDVEKDKFGKQTLKLQKKINLKNQHNKKLNYFKQDTQKKQFNGSEPPKVLFKQLNSIVQQDKLDDSVKKQKNKQKKADIITKNENKEENIIKNIQIKQQSIIKSKQKDHSNSKAIKGQLRRKQQKMLTNHINQSIKQKGTPNSLKKIKFDYKQSLSDTSKKETKEATNDLQNKTKTEQKSINQLQATSEGEKGLEKQTLKLDTKRQKSEFQMYQVTEEENEQQTAKPSFENSINPSMKSMQFNQSTLIQKLNRQLKKITNLKAFTLNHQYSLIINPSSQKIIKNNKNQDNFTKETDLIIRNDDKSYKKLLKLFEYLSQNGSKSQTDTQKIRKWKKAILNYLRLNIISQDQIDKITQVIKGQSFAKGCSSIYQNSVSSKGSISHHIRNSLPQIQQITNLSPNIKIATVIKPKHFLTLSAKQQQNSKQNSRLESLLQQQQQIENLIKYQSLQTNFPQKIHHLHKNCEQGALCTHVTKYFDAILKHYQQVKKKQRPFFALPIQKIGNRSKIEEQVLNKEMKQVQQNKSLTVYKPSQKINSYRNSSLIKNQYSQQIILPNINDYKLKNISHSVFKQKII